MQICNRLQQTPNVQTGPPTTKTNKSRECTSHQKSPNPFRSLYGPLPREIEKVKEKTISNALQPPSMEPICSSKIDVSSSRNDMTDGPSDSLAGHWCFPLPLSPRRWIAYRPWHLPAVCSALWPLLASCYSPGPLLAVCSSPRFLLAVYSPPSFR